MSATIARFGEKSLLSNNRIHCSIAISSVLVSFWPLGVCKPPGLRPLYRFHVLSIGAPKVIAAARRDFF
jgi:hypothetical protein